MTEKKKIFAILGSAGRHSANERLIENFVKQTSDFFSVAVFNDLKSLPHFDPDCSVENPPDKIIAFRKNIEQADGILICTPEYVFSIPSGLKNAIEWCVATTVFSGKPTGLITASASGEKAHEELQLIMKTLMAAFTDETTILIPGVKSKIDNDASITDAPTKKAFVQFIEAFKAIVLCNKS